MAVLDDLGVYLQDEGLGTLGTDLFLGGIPLDLPADVHPDALTALAESSGFPPASVHSLRGPALRQPAVDLLVRGAPYDYTGPRAHAQQVYLALSAIDNQQLSGSFYLWVRPLQSIYKRSQDDCARMIMTCQFRIAYAVEEWMPALRKYVVDFANTVTWTILGTAHNLQTADVLIEVYDTAVPRNRVDLLHSVHPTTFDITFPGLAAPMSGRVVVIG